MDKTKFYCMNSAQRVHNDRAEHCIAYEHIQYRPGIRTCGTCIHHCALNADGSVPDDICTGVDHSAEYGSLIF